ncbi:MAG: hypothetical protein V1778_04225 [bacterium]
MRYIGLTFARLSPILLPVEVSFFPLAVISAFTTVPGEVVVREFWTPFLREVSRVVQTMVNQLGNPMYAGGYLCVKNAAGEVLFIIRILTPSEALGDKAFVLCQEKCDRTREHGHESAAQSRDDENGKYPGAFRVPIEMPREVYYIGFSGLPWANDELAVIIPLLRLHWMNKGSAEELLVHSGNMHLEETLATFSIYD